MDSVSLCLLKQLAKKREMPLRECAELLPKITNDHLDFYPLASLIKRGMVDIHTKTDGKPFRESNERELATLLYGYLSVSVDKGVSEYQGMWFSGHGFGDEKLFATAIGYFALDEMRSKRSERIWAFAAGIFTAVVAASLKGFLS